MKFYLEHDPETLQQVAETLLAGSVVALPTETVYGLVTLWDNVAAREEIYRLKHRPHEKRLQMLADSVDTACRFGLLPDKRLQAIARAFWPGGLTVVAPAVQESIGLRIPAHPFVLALLKKIQRPLAATSANLAGMPPGLTLTEAIAGLDGEPDAGVDGGYASCTAGSASTVVSLLGDTPVILREGPISLHQIQQTLAAHINR